VCDQCNRTFSSWDACKQHMSALNPWYTDKCDPRDRRFANKTEAGQHMDSVGHRSSPYCTSCDRYLQDLSDLYLHFNSPSHLRVDPTHLAPALPVRSASSSRPAPANVPAPPAVVLSSTRPTTNPSTAPRLDPVFITVPAQPVIATPSFISIPAVDTSQTASSVLPNIWPVTPGTTSIPFEVYVDKYGCSSTISHYQSITFMRPYQTFSFEELRLSDYRAGCNATIERAGAVVRVIYRGQATQTGIDTVPASSVYVPPGCPRATTTGITVNDYNAKGRDPTNIKSALSQSETEPQHGESVARPRVFICPFCQSDFNAVWEVAEHLKSTSREQSPDLSRSSMHRRQCQQDPDEVMTVHAANRNVDNHMSELPLYRCPNKAGSCKGKLMTSFAELLAHLESEICGFIKREDL
jgi:hypothetical protein